MVTIGAQVEQVGEHLGGARALFTFEVEAYPEAKILKAAELKTLHQRLGDWYRVAELIGASEAFTRQNGKNKNA